LSELDYIQEKQSELTSESRKELDLFAYFLGKCQKVGPVRGQGAKKEIYSLNNNPCAEFSDTNENVLTLKKYSSTDSKDLNTADTTQQDFW